LFLKQPLSNSTVRTALPVGSNRVVLKLIILVWGLEAILSQKECFITFLLYFYTRWWTSPWSTRCQVWDTTVIILQFGLKSISNITVSNVTKLLQIWSPKFIFQFQIKYNFLVCNTVPTRKQFMGWWWWWYISKVNMCT